MLTLELAAAGLAFGSLAAISGLGLLITYRATGVFNLAHGAIAMFVAYVYWWLSGGHGWPVLLAAPVAVLLVGPGVGVLAYRFVFRGLQRRAAAPAESLVASLGLFVLLVGAAAVAWGLQARRVRPVLPSHRLAVGGAGIRSDALVDLGVVAVVLVVLWAVTTRTRLGVQVRAVVDARVLAELTRIDADRVATLGWATGAGFAGLTGVLLAPQLSLTPYGLTLVVLETFAVPVVARLSSLPVAVGAALAIGVAQSELAQVHAPAGLLADVLRSVQANLLALVLLVALLLLPRLHEVGSAAERSRGIAGRVDLVRRKVTPLRVMLGLVLLGAPLAFPADVLRDAQQVPALALVLVSLVVLTGYSGQISLGQGAYAGLGALFFATFSDSIPEIPALACGMLAAGIVGFLTGYPAIRRRGLFLALTTFAVGVAVSRFVLQQPAFTTGVSVRRPDAFGVSLAGDRAFYGFELACLLVGLGLARNLRTGRLGRALVAMRDSEVGAQSLGLDLRQLKVFVFTTSAALAGLGGALLAQSTLSLDPNRFEPVQSSLFWFTAVVVFGADSATGAVVAAGSIVAVGALLGSADAALVPLGALALVLGRRPGGLAGLSRAAGRLPAVPVRWRERFAAARPSAAPVTLSPLGRSLQGRLRS